VPRPEPDWHCSKQAPRDEAALGRYERWDGERKETSVSRHERRSKGEEYETGGGPTEQRVRAGRNVTSVEVTEGRTRGRGFGTKLAGQEVVPFWDEAVRSEITHQGGEPRPIAGKSDVRQRKEN
jgi:hypothetical protein